MSSNRTKKTTNTNAATTATTATQVAELIASAKTPAQKGNATRRLRAYVASRETAGCDPQKVESQVRRIVTSLGRGK